MQRTGFLNKKRVIFFGGIALIAAAIYYGFGMTSEEAPKQGGGGVPVETAVVEPRSLDVTIDAVGTLVANEMVTLRPEIAGKITDVQFTEGTPVKKGDPLFKIDDRMARAELKQAESNSQLAKLNYERFRKLSSTGAATKLRYDEARAELGVTQANVDVARTRVEYMTITAPFDGVVGLRSVSPGEYVNVGQELANFVSYDPMKVNFTIPETQASQLGVNQEIAMTVEAIPGQTFKGVVYALDPQIDVNGRAVSLRATIPNTENLLKPGMFARVLLLVSRKDNALTIPESAIVPVGNDKQVFVVDAESKAHLVTIELGERLAGAVEVTKGLNAGDVVVTSGQIKLQPGAPVTDLRAAATKQNDAVPVAEAPVEPTPEPEAAPAADMVAPAEQQPVAEDLDALQSIPVSEEPLSEDERAVTPPTESAEGNAQ